MDMVCLPSKFASGGDALIKDLRDIERLKEIVLDARHENG